MLTAEQLRGARAILRIEQTALAEKAGVSVETIKRLEAQKGPLQAYFDTLYGIKRALEREGIEFLNKSEDGGPGVRVVADRNAVMIDQITHHFTMVISGALTELLRRDSEFVTRKTSDSEFVISTKCLEQIAIVAARGVPYVLRGQELPADLQSLLERVLEKQIDPTIAALRSLIDPFADFGRTSSRSAVQRSAKNSDEDEPK